jgi:mannose-6-phosphate isomerase-like protein (cupin superfamily)
MQRMFIASLVTLFLLPVFNVSEAQQSTQVTRVYDQLDPRPYDPATEPDIDMYMSNYRESNNRGLFGAMVERDILTPLVGPDQMHPTRRGAVLNNIKLLSFVTLPAGQRVVNAKIDPALKEQRLFYCAAGTGTIESAGKTYKIYEGVGVIIPPDITFSMHNAGTNEMTFYVITEKLPADFTPLKEIAWADEAAAAFSSNTVHWTHNYKTLFSRKTGLATINCGPVWFMPMTMGQPHSHNEKTEEIWFSIHGDIKVMMGKELREFQEGTAYKIPPNNQTPHANINVSNQVVKVFWFMN